MGVGGGGRERKVRDPSEKNTETQTEEWWGVGGGGSTQNIKLGRADEIKNR